MAGIPSPWQGSLWGRRGFCSPECRPQQGWRRRPESELGWSGESCCDPPSVVRSEAPSYVGRNWLWIKFKCIEWIIWNWKGFLLKLHTCRSLFDWYWRWRECWSQGGRSSASPPPSAWATWSGGLWGIRSQDQWMSAEPTKLLWTFLCQAVRSLQILIIVTSWFLDYQLLTIITLRDNSNMM